MSHVIKMCYESSGCGYSCSSGAGGYSGLERAVSSYSSVNSAYQAGSDYSGDVSYIIAETNNANALQRIAAYDLSIKKDDYGGIALEDYSPRKLITTTYSHVSDDFLNPNRPTSAFIGDAAEIKEFIEEAFLATTGREFPNDIIINIVDKKTMKKAHSIFADRWDEGIEGFAINRKDKGLISEIFVKKGELDRIMLTIGHEIGHVLTRKLDNAQDEEAKAFAFSLAWMKAIKENNIANLAASISLGRPAANGLHNVALDFVLNLRKNGIDLLYAFNELAGGRLRIAG